MASASATLLSLSLSFLLLFRGCLGRQSLQQSPNECQFRQINAAEPSLRVKAEAGATEFWDPLDEQFRCGGAHLFRHIIQPKGLLLPSYTNSPLLAYVLRGTGYFGIVYPGCAETYESSPSRSLEEGDADRHQKIGLFRQGDILALEEGVAHWIYNNGQDDVVLLVIQDTANDANQHSDPLPLRFFLAGNPRQRGQQDSGSQQQKLLEHLGFSGNVVGELRNRFLRDSFNTDRETVESISGNDDRRGHIVNVEEGLDLIVPGFSDRSSNGLEETVCTRKVRINIDDPTRADIYDPQAGRIASATRSSLPILSEINLSAARGVLKPNYGIVPNWLVNAHSYLYATRGSAWIQIVNQRGESIMDQRIKEGELILAPQNFIVVMQASDEGFEWIELLTSGDATASKLTGRASTVTGLPADVIAASYRIPREKALELKRSMVSTWFFRGTSGRKSGRVGSKHSKGVRPYALGMLELMMKI